MIRTSVSFLRDLWGLTKPYFISSEGRSACAFLFLIVSLNLFQVYLSVQFNSWYGIFYDALQNKNEDVYINQLWIFAGLATLFIVTALTRSYLNLVLEIRWRRWLTERYTSEWLAGHTYYHLQFATTGTDNPDQRIADDIRLFIERTLSLSLGLLSSIVTLISFAGILWALSGPLSLSFAGLDDVSIPGFMVWMAILYALVGTILTHLIGRRLISINFNQQRLEADFRFAMMRLRENQESIALLSGEDVELKRFADRFDGIITNWWNIIKYQMRLISFTSGFNQISIIFPFIVAAPRYFSGEITLGVLMQTSSAFGQVQNALTFFVDAYSQITDWAAVINRLTGFEQAVRAIRSDRQQSQRITLSASPDGRLKLDKVELALPDGTVLARVDDVIAPGERVMIDGPTGAGKTTLFRAIAGLWTYGQGRIVLPDGVMFLPQRPYLPIGTVKEMVTYPRLPSMIADEVARAALMDVGLERLANRLDDSRHWEQCLSGGEQQRIGFARVLIEKPEWIFLDESTSALDRDSETKLYRLLQERLPGSAIISIAHHRALSTLHERQIKLTPHQSP